MTTVFVSSTTQDLPGHREEVCNAVGRLGLKCECIESFPAAPQSHESFLRETIEGSDIFVGILGLCYGSRLAGTGKSYTEFEYETAQALGKPCYMFLSSDDMMVPARTIAQDKGWDEQVRFREMVRSRHICPTFFSPTELRNQVYGTLLQVVGDSRSHAGDVVDSVVLCGGYAVRLWPLTYDLCKVLLPVGGSPVIARLMRFVRAAQGVGRTVLSTNAKFAEQISTFATSFGIPSEDVVVEPAGTQGRKLGPIGALEYLVRLSAPRDLLILGGDNLFGFELQDFLEFALAKDSSSVAFYRIPVADDLSEYGVGRVGDSGTVEDLVEKPKTVTSFRDVSTACYFLRAREVEAVSAYIQAGGDADSLGEFLTWLKAERGVPLYGYVFDSFWFDVGTREKLLEANRHFLRHNVRGHIEGKCSIMPPAWVDEEATVRDSAIGPHVYVASGASVTGCTELSNSVVMEGAEVSSCRVRDSLFGPRSRVEGGPVRGGVFGPDTKADLSGLGGGLPA